MGLVLFISIWNLLGPGQVDDNDNPGEWTHHGAADLADSDGNPLQKHVLPQMLYHPGMVEPTIVGRAEPSQSCSKLDLLEPS